MGSFGSGYNSSIPVRTHFARTKQFRWLKQAICCAALAGACAAQETSRVPLFGDYPFDQWAAAPEHAAIKWEVHVQAAQLSIHQRLMERVQVVVPGGELEKRRGRGELVLLARFEDSDGRQWRSGTRLNLEKVQAGVKSRELTFTVAAFVRPGEYTVQVALLDTKTMEHSFTRRTMHVAAMKGDPLPEAWAGLPPVEVLPPIDGADAWFLPAVKGLLHLPVETSGKPSPKIQILMNMTPSERSAGTAGAVRRTLAAVVPVFKVLSAMRSEGAPTPAAVLDLARHRVAYEAQNAGRVDWSALSKALTENPPGVIDAKSLAKQSSMREYFAGEVARRAAGAGAKRWVIILSAPVMFSKQEETPLPEMTADPDRHIVYLRVSTGFGGGPMPGTMEPPPDIQIGPVTRVRGPMPLLGDVTPGFTARGRGPRGGDAMFPDDLERVLRPMGAQIYSVTTPDSFRRILAALIAEISAGK